MTCPCARPTPPTAGQRMARRSNGSGDWRRAKRRIMMVNDQCSSGGGLGGCGLRQVLPPNLCPVSVEGTSKARSISVRSAGDRWSNSTLRQHGRPVGARSGSTAPDSTLVVRPAPCTGRAAADPRVREARPPARSRRGPDAHRAATGRGVADQRYAPSSGSPDRWTERSQESSRS